MSRRVPRSRAAVETATRRAMMARDAGLRRIAAVTRWTAVAVVALSGALALIAAKAFHGHTVTSTPAAGSSTQTPAAPAWAPARAAGRWGSAWSARGPARWASGSSCRRPGCS